MKLCSDCHQTKHLHCFGSSRDRPDGLNRCCKDCVNAYARRRKTLEWKTSNTIRKEAIAKATALCTKKCGRCLIEKPNQSFGVHLDGRYASRGGRRIWCSACCAAYVREKRAANLVEFRAREKTYISKDPERRRETNRRAHKRFAVANPEKIKQSTRATLARRRAKDPQFRAIIAAKAHVWRLVKGEIIGRSFDVLGYTRADFIAGLESQFAEGMSWANYGHIGENWHVDHIRPIASFNPNGYASRAEYVRAVFALNNLQPMWGADNRSKSSNWEGRRWRRQDHIPEVSNA